MWKRGVKVALEECLEVNRNDRTIIFADRENREIGDEFLRVSREIAGEAYMVLLEDFGTRPITTYPWPLREYVDFVGPTVSLYVATTAPGELPLRKGIIEHVLSFGAKHAHMPSISKKILETGLNNCHNVEELTLKGKNILENAREIYVRTHLGTELYVEVGKYRWIPDTGKIPYGDWANLPGGEVFTTPSKIEGIAVADGSLGDYFKKYGKLKWPVTFIIEGSELVDVKSENENLAREIWNYLTKYENGTRIGEFAIGTNTNIKEIIGNLLQDEKHPGVHIAFGDPIGKKTGAEWTSKVHMDAVITKTDVRVDEKWLMREGSFLIN